MTDTKFYKMMGALQLMIAFINFYVAMSVVQAGTGLLNIAVGTVCTMAGVFCTVIGGKLIGVLND